MRVGDGGVGPVLERKIDKAGSGSEPDIPTELAASGGYGGNRTCSRVRDTSEVLFRVRGLTGALPIGVRLLAASAAGLAGFGLAACLLLLDATSHGFPPIEGWSILSLFVAVPAAAVALMPFSGRLFCFGLSLIAALAASLIGVSGADNPMAIVQFAAICVTAAVVVAEVCVRVALRLARPRATAGNG